MTTSWIKKTLASENLRKRPFYKPPADLTRHTALRASAAAGFSAKITRFTKRCSKSEKSSLNLKFLNQVHCFA